MKRTAGAKPVRKCHTCMLNLGDVCWEYTCPRRQWRGRRCPGFENQKLYKELKEWQAAPHVKTRKQLRQAAFRNRARPTFPRHRKVAGKSSEKT